MLGCGACSCSADHLSMQSCLCSASSPSSSTPCDPRLLDPWLQGEEPWRATDMAAAVETFRARFLDTLQADVKAGLAEKARAAAAQPTLAW